MLPLLTSPLHPEHMIRALPLRPWAKAENGRGKGKAEEDRKANHTWQKPAAQDQ